MFKTNTLLRALVAAGLASSLVACGGGSSGSSDADGGNDGKNPPVNPPPSSEKLTGQFVDSPVQGLTYVTSSGSGTTNANGEFTYKDGDEISILIGNTLVGQSIAAQILTPADIADDTSNPDKVTNILRLLQSLDENSDPSDGIVIPENALTLAGSQGVEINFDQPAEDFENDTTVSRLLSEAGQTALITAEQANTHFNQTINNLPVEIDIRGTWLATSVYTLRGESCEATATWTFKVDGISVTGDELNPEWSETEGLACNTASLNFNSAYNNSDLESDFGWGCSGGACTFGDLNRKVKEWDLRERSWQHPEYGTIKEKDYSVVHLSHGLGSDVMVRLKEDFNQSTPVSAPEEQSIQKFGEFKTTFIRKEAVDYKKDMRGTWEVTSKRKSCPETSATHTLTYSDTGITIVGQELNSQNGVCKIENVNATFAYNDPELPAEFCGPLCTWEELNGRFSDEGDTIKLSHKRGTNIINRTKGSDSREVWIKQ